MQSLEAAVNHYGNWMDATARHSKFRHIIACEPDFDHYKRALAEAGAWEEGQEPDEKTIKDMEAYRLLVEWATDFQDKFVHFHETNRLGHVRILKELFGTFYKHSKGRTAPTKKFAQDFLEEMVGERGGRTGEGKGFAKAVAVQRIISDPSRVGEVSKGFMDLADHYLCLETDYDIAILDALPREEQTKAEQVRDVVPFLLEQKSKEKEPRKRAETSKTFLELVRSTTDLEKRIDLLEVVDRAMVEEEVDTLSLYRRLRRTGLKPREYVEFLLSGDQFSWRPEGSKATMDFVTGRGLQGVDPVSAYLMVARANFNILKALEEIAKNRTGAPAAKELILNPSLLFVDANTPELVTLARDYQHGTLIVKRYATVRAEGLDDRAEAVLHVGKLRPNLDDLTEIRKGMRALPEEEVRFVSGCDTIEGIKRLVKRKTTSKKEMPYQRQNLSWFDLMKKSLVARGATTEELSSLERAHGLLSDNGGKPRFLRNMFRTQPEDLGQLCDHIAAHHGSKTFTLIMQRESLFERYKHGLAIDSKFGENLSGFVAREHPNPYAALKEHLPELSVEEELELEPAYLGEEPKPIPIEEFPGRVIICGGTFRPRLRQRIEQELPGVVFGPDKKRLKREGVPGLSENDAVLWVVPGSDHNGHDKVKGQCEKSGTIFEISRSDGVKSVVTTIRDQILTRGTRT